ncbi:hypothetical protein CHUAL_000716 [Chamberlinius hualienensis]
MDNCATFDCLAPLLPLSKLRFISLDFPGHGHSSYIPPGRWYNWTDYLGSVIRTVNHLKLDKFSLLAHSMGGKIGYLYAGIYPEKVKRMVVLDIIRPIPGGKAILLEPQEGDHNDWDYTKFYKSMYNYLIQTEIVTPSKSVTVGRPMAELAESMALGRNYLHFMTVDSATILLKRGTRLVNKDPELYALTKDPRLRIYDLCISDAIVHQFCKNIHCDLLVVAPEQGIIVKQFSKLVNIFELFKENLNVFKVKYVKGHHHVHLIDPDEISSIVSNFLLTSE